MRARDRIVDRSHGNRPWDPSEDALLGTMSDAEVAARVRRSASSVANRRRTQGVAAYTGRRSWTDEEIALLGTDTDANIGRRIGRSAAVIAQKRYQERIPAYQRSHGALNGVIAERAVSSLADTQPWGNQELAWLGVLTDQQVADRTARTVPNIAATRRALGRASVDEIVAAINRCADSMDVPMVMCLWYGRTQAFPSVETLIEACGIPRPTAYRQLARAKKVATIMWPDDAQPQETEAANAPE